MISRGLPRFVCIGLLTAAIALSGAVFFGETADAQSHHASLVYPGDDGRLVYVPDENGGVIPDYSHAGYGGGGVQLPRVQVRATVAPGQGNDTKLIQEAIDTVSAMPVDKNGFRGAVLLKKGRYVLDEPLRIEKGGVILRGEGQGEDGTVLFGRGVITTKNFWDRYWSATLIIIGGTTGIEEVPDSARRITDEYVPFGAKSFHVEAAADFKVGDTVIVRRFGNDAWFEEIGIEVNNDKWKNTQRNYDFDRIITNIEGNRVMVDAPITCAIESRWGGGELVKYTDAGRIRQVGVENLRGVSDFDRSVRTTEYTNMDRQPYIGEEYYADEDHYWNFITIGNAVHAWVRDITVLHFASSSVLIREGGKWITVQDCTTREPVSRAGGGRRFTYQICGQLCLVQRCTSDKGRHSFVLGGFLTCGPNVFLDCRATKPYSSSEPHSDLVTGSLYDNIEAPLAFRFAKSNPVRWMGINGVMWNCEGMHIVQKPPTAQNYAFGHVGIHAMVFNKNLIDYSFPNGHIESWDNHVEPRSLYLKQLEDRLGRSTVRSIATKEQLEN